jgi:hypothetical protein
MTMMSTVSPAEPGGLATRIWLSSLTKNLGAGVLPNLTAVVLLKPLPLMMTVVPPAEGPFAGVTPLILGPNGAM